MMKEQRLEERNSYSDTFLFALFIQELCLRSLPEVSHLMDYTVLKTNIIPRLKRVYTRVDLVNVSV